MRRSERLAAPCGGGATACRCGPFASSFYDLTTTGPVYGGAAASGNAVVYDADGRAQRTITVTPRDAEGLATVE